MNLEHISPLAILGEEKVGVRICRCFGCDKDLPLREGVLIQTYYHVKRDEYHYGYVFFCSATCFLNGSVIEVGNT